ncbi:hypothetical protein ACFFUB_01075 [Algimonas porphyrae]|uniref:Uncharacterized protein n=1 Tax=Algimonas porphyrae TaxID=1128113 RepID=A0ABQ5V0Z0_9PROT|nr:hypothetical protein [Algimonas porphyrae]GLQ20627.1 hypothetical protein GCM10007854_15820 [Algimonas porphyrae]
MSQKRAHRRYTFTMIGASLAYIGSVIGVALLTDDADPLTPLTLIAVFLPGIPILYMLWAMWRYLNEVDEVGRHFLTRAFMMALFGALAISGVWGLGELFLEALPRLPVFYIFPITMGLFGLATAFGPARGMHCA